MVSLTIADYFDCPINYLLTLFLVMSPRNLASYFCINWPNMCCCSAVDCGGGCIKSKIDIWFGFGFQNVLFSFGLVLSDFVAWKMCWRQFCEKSVGHSLHWKFYFPKICNIFWIFFLWAAKQIHLFGFLKMFNFCLKKISGFLGIFSKSILILIILFVFCMFSSKKYTIILLIHWRRWCHMVFLHQ